EMAKENAEKLGFGSQHMLMPVNESAYDSVEASDDGNESLEAELNALPLYAQVSVLETGRSAKTNPQDGSYSFMHAAGTYTVVAESYGFASEEQTVDVEEDGTITANFMLEELPKATVSGTVVNERTGEPVEGA